MEIWAALKSKDEYDTPCQRRTALTDLPVPDGCANGVVGDSHETMVMRPQIEQEVMKRIYMGQSSRWRAKRELASVASGSKRASNSLSSGFPTAATGQIPTPAVEVRKEPFSRHSLLDDPVFLFHQRFEIATKSSGTVQAFLASPLRAAGTRHRIVA